VLIPKTLWILWYQGYSEAPPVVKKCIDSWVRENSNWQIVILDKSNIGDYFEVDIPEGKFASLSLTKQSNIIRLQLLSKYGGVWADATTYCMKPLDDWLWDYTSTGFFVFHSPGADRLLATWFIASEKANPIVLEWRKRMTIFFAENYFDINGRFNKVIIKTLSKLLNKNNRTTKYWFSPIVTKLLRVYPYFICHYIFERLVTTDQQCQNLWKNTHKVSADGPHNIQNIGLHSPIDETTKTEIDEKRIPLYKLNWRYDQSKYSSSSILFYLLEGRFQKY
jgi:hypothetical protein